MVETKDLKLLIGFEDPRLGKVFALLKYGLNADTVAYSTSIPHEKQWPADQLHLPSAKLALDYLLYVPG